MTDHLLTAFALVFVIEGLLYAMFPDFVRKMMATALTLEGTQLRNFGLGIAAFGVFWIWILQQLS